MLCLQSESQAAWIQVAIDNPDAILIDHAHCEKKAAAFALAMVSRYPDRMRLVRDMIELAKEELDHLGIVVGILDRRGVQLDADKANPYIKALNAHVRTTEPDRLLDLLVVGAFIEARSCERFSLLAKHCPDESMRLLYADLLASEAGHYRAYTDIAREYLSDIVVRQRLAEFGAIEAEIVRNLTNQPTIHG